MSRPPSTPSIASLTDAKLAVPNADRIGFIAGSEALLGRLFSWRSVLSRADLVDLQQASETWRSAAVSARFSQSLVTPALSELVTGEAVSGNYFTTLGLSPTAGRLIQPSDDAAPALVVVVSHQFWRTRLGADPDAVGSTLRIGGKTFEVIGIAPAGFGGLVDRIQSFTAIWVPLSATTMFPSTAAPPENAQDRRRLQLSVFIIRKGARRIRIARTRASGNRGATRRGISNRSALHDGRCSAEGRALLVDPFGCGDQ